MKFKNHLHNLSAMNSHAVFPMALTLPKDIWIWAKLKPYWKNPGSQIYHLSVFRSHTIRKILLSLASKVMDSASPGPLITARNWKKSRCPSSKIWIKTMWLIYKMEFYSASKNKNIMNLAGKWIQLGIIILSEVSQTQKDMDVCTHGLMNNNHKVQDICMTFLCSEEAKQEGSLRGWIDGSAGKSSCEGPEFISQHRHGGSQPPVMRFDALFWCVWKQIQGTYI